MDPNATLDLLRQTCRDAISQLTSEEGIELNDATELLDTMVEQFGALDMWLTAGGFRPKDWRKVR